MGIEFSSSLPHAALFPFRQFSVFLFPTYTLCHTHVMRGLVRVNISPHPFQNRDVPLAKCCISGRVSRRWNDGLKWYLNNEKLFTAVRPDN